MVRGLEANVHLARSVRGLGTEEAHRRFQSAATAFRGRIGLRCQLTVETGVRCRGFPAMGRPTRPGVLRETHAGFVFETFGDSARRSVLL